MKEISTTILIKAPADVVWRILLDFSNYPEWNPFITEITGDANVGGRLRISARLSERRGMTFKPTVKTRTLNTELKWLGSLLVPGLFDGEHRFRLEARSHDRTDFIQEERFTGILVPLLWKWIASDTEKGFHKMNEALKQRAERLHSRSQSK